MKVCVIGTGVMGKNHARVYSEMDGVELAAVSDVNEKTGREVAGKHGCKYYGDYKEMLRTERPCAVSVCVPTAFHYEVARNVIERGVNLLIEKPISDDVGKAEKLVNLAEKNGVVLAVGHIERFNPAVQELKIIIDSGRLGKITSILARRVGIMPPRIKDANVVIDIAVHDIDVFSYLLGKYPVSIYASGGHALLNKRDDYADIFLKYNGTNGFIEVNWITPVKIRVLNVTGTKGYASLNYITQELTLYESIYERDYDEFGDFVINFGEPRKIPVNIKRGEPLRIELSEFIKSVKSGKSPLVTGRDGLKALKTAVDIMKSMGV